MRHRGEALELGPSALVDLGVHTITPDTVVNAELCQQDKGRHFLQYVPGVEFKNDGTVLRTAHLVATADWDVDLPLRADAPLLSLPSRQRLALSPENGAGPGCPAGPHAHWRETAAITHTAPTYPPG